MSTYVSIGVFFFFKQKTAYEMRISDWSSDVCSSDLVGRRGGRVAVIGGGRTHFGKESAPPPMRGEIARAAEGVLAGQFGQAHQIVAKPLIEIGRASCRERVCQYV